MPLPQFLHLLWWGQARAGAKVGRRGTAHPFGGAPLPAPHSGGLLPGPPAPCFAHFFPYWSVAQAWDAEGVALFSLHRTGGVGG